MHPTRHAFTLIEMAVVLIIIALVTGGILGGTTMIQASRLQRVTADAVGVREATRLFYDRFRALPGDYSAAFGTWALCVDIGANTCNGNGDGQISGTTEPFRFWQHLRFSGYTSPVMTGNGPNITPGTNVLSGILEGSAYRVIWETNAGLTRNYLHFGNFTLTQEEIMSAVDAQGVDQKLDDGRATSGAIMGFGGGTGCPLASSTTANYDISISGPTCRLIFDWFPGYRP